MGQRGDFCWDKDGYASFKETPRGKWYILKRYENEMPVVIKTK